MQPPPHPGTFFIVVSASSRVCQRENAMFLQGVTNAKGPSPLICIASFPRIRFALATQGDFAMVTSYAAKRSCNSHIPCQYPALQPDPPSSYLTIRPPAMGAHPGGMVNLSHAVWRGAITY